MLKLILLAIVVQAGKVATAQPAASHDSARIAALEQRVEDAVVAHLRAVLDSVYAPGFRFSHATGESQTRAEWLASVGHARFASRRVDSLEVEVHGTVALTTGRLHVRLAPEDPDWAQAPRWREYTVRYARVYVKRGGRWQLLTHHSTGLTFGPLQAPARFSPPAGEALQPTAQPRSIGSPAGESILVRLASMYIHAHITLCALHLGFAQECS